LNCDATKSYFPGDIHCPNATTLAAFRQAVNDQVFWWHAFPFNAEPETYDPSLFKSALATAKRLAGQFNKKAPIALSQRDVPGMTRAVVPILRQAGIEAITVGVNEASAPPAVPGIFLWGSSKSPSDSIVTVRLSLFVADIAFLLIQCPAFRSITQGDTVASTRRT
jgi:hypothetical protein